MDNTEETARRILNAVLSELRNRKRLDPEAIIQSEEIYAEFKESLHNRIMLILNSTPECHPA